MQLDDAERSHLFHLAQAADGATAAMRPELSPSGGRCGLSLHWTFDAITTGPAATDGASEPSGRPGDGIPHLRQAPSPAPPAQPKARCLVISSVRSGRPRRRRPGPGSLNPERARAAFAFVHGILIVELNGCSPNGGSLEPAWRGTRRLHHRGPGGSITMTSTGWTPGWTPRLFRAGRLPVRLTGRRRCPLPGRAWSRPGSGLRLIPGRVPHARVANPAGAQE
jgi:hypothetical protein